MDERWRRRDRVAEDPAVPRDRRRGDRPGLDRADSGHQRERRPRCVRRAGPGARSRAGHADHGFAVGIGVTPEGIVWISYYSRFPGGIVRSTQGRTRRRPRSRRCMRCRGTIRAAQDAGFSPRGMDVDRNGVVWLPLASGHLASFDRSRCAGPLNGPTATGQRSPEGWTFYPEPLPSVSGVERPGTAGASYYTWVDQFNTLGLGANVPINTGNTAEALLALQNGSWVQLRVPYPIGFFAKWLDGRIDDPNAGWKGAACGRQSRAARPGTWRRGRARRESHALPAPPGSRSRSKTDRRHFTMEALCLEPSRRVPGPTSPPPPRFGTARTRPARSSSAASRRSRRWNHRSAHSSRPTTPARGPRRTRRPSAGETARRFR